MREGNEISKEDSFDEAPARVEVNAVARILVIDDAPDARALFQQALESVGHEVVLAADGIEGIREYCAQPADLVITDIYMPNQDGLETIVELRRRCPEVAIIGMSGWNAARTMLSIAQKLGALQVLQKPFTVDELLAAVEKALRVNSGPV